MAQIKLTSEEVERLRRPVEGRGGLQSLLRRLGKSILQDGTLVVSDEDVEKIRRYTGRYGQGGFQDRLKPLLPLLNRGESDRAQATLEKEW